MLAHNKGDAAGAVVGAGTIVGDAAAKLGEHKQHDFIAGIVFSQVLVESVHVVGHVRPKAGMQGGLIGVGVKAVVRGGGVEHPAAEPGQMGLGDVLHVLADYRVGVLDAAGVLVGGGGQDVGALEGVGAGAVDVVHDGASAHGRGVHAAEHVQSIIALLFAVDAGQQSIGLQVADRGDGHAFHYQGAGKAAAEVDPSQHVFSVGVNFLEDATQPPLGADLVRLAGVPDVHGPEMGVARVLVADAQENGQLPFVPELLQRTHGGVESQVVIDGNNLPFGNAQSGAIVPIQGIAIGNHGIQAIVAAGKGQNGQYRVFLCRNHILFSFY